MPLFTYGASIWYPAFMNNDIFKKYRTFNYNCCKSIVKSYRTISIVNSRLLSNTIPLELEIFMNSQLELIRITGVISDKVINDKLINIETYRPFNFYNNLFEIYNKEHNLIEIKDNQQLEFGNQNLLEIEPLIKWTCLPTGENKIAINVINEQEIEENNKIFDYYIYTDGSNRLDYGTGCGYIIMKENNSSAEIHRDRSPMHPLCSTFQAEMFGIYKGLEWSLNNLKPINKTILIKTDSESALQKLRDIFTDSLIPFYINACLQKLKQINCQVYFTKVQAHAGIKGNVIADSLAKKASLISENHKVSGELLEYNYLPTSFAKYKIKTQCKNAFLESAFNEEFIDDRAKINNWTKNFIPNRSKINHKLLKLCDYYTTQVVTGHGPFKSYLVNKTVLDDKCTLCKGEVDDCTKNYTETLKEMNINKPDDLTNVLTKENIKKFKELSKKIVEERSIIVEKEKIITKEKDSKYKKEMKTKKNKREDKLVRKPEAKYIKTRKSKEKATNKPFENEGNIPKKIAEINTKAPKEQILNLLHKITNTSHLNDDHIFKFCKEIRNRNSNKKYLIFDPIVFTNEEHSVNYLNRNITTEIESILIIIHKGALENGHWLTGLIDLRSKSISIVDSMGETNHGTLFNKLYRIADIAL